MRGFAHVAWPHGVGDPHGRMAHGRMGSGQANMPIGLRKARKSGSLLIFAFVFTAATQVSSSKSRRGVTKSDGLHAMICFGLKCRGVGPPIGSHGVGPGQEGEYIDFVSFREPQILPWISKAQEFIGYLSGLIEKQAS